VRPLLTRNSHRKELEITSGGKRELSEPIRLSEMRRGDEPVKERMGGVF